MAITSDENLCVKNILTTKKTHRRSTVFWCLRMNQKLHRPQHLHSLQELLPTPWLQRSTYGPFLSLSLNRETQHPPVLRSMLSAWTTCLQRWVLPKHPARKQLLWVRENTHLQASTSRALLHTYSTRDPWDHVTIPRTGQPTYHNIPLLKLFGCLNEIMLIQVKTGTRS